MSSRHRIETTVTIAGLALLPISIASFAIALRFPEITESLYSETLYPEVTRGFATLNLLPFSVAEPLLIILAFVAALSVYRFTRHGDRRWRRALMAVWALAGASSGLFLILWGFNYAQPSLGIRMELSGEDVAAEAVLDAGVRAARLTSVLYQELDPAMTPTELPFEFDALNQRLDNAYEQIQLPGGAIDFRPTPAKRLWSSTLISYLGISGIFIPFTGEPSVNALQPDVSLPMVVAHEKAHQRGVTHEGEANFAAFLACAHGSSHVYIRYAAYLFATRYLLREASFYLPREDVEAAWNLLGDGPKEDIRAIREFWQRYEGPASTAATRVNDRYLRTMQVPGGVQSYGTVVQLLIALDREGKLFAEP